MGENAQLLGGADLAAVFQESLKKMGIMIEKARKSRSRLRILRLTLRDLTPLVEEIKKFSENLDHPMEEIEELIWEKDAGYEDLGQRHCSVVKCFPLSIMRVEKRMERDVKETLNQVKNALEMISKDTSGQRIMCLPPPLKPEFVNAIDEPLKMELLKDGVSVLSQRERVVQRATKERKDENGESSRKLVKAMAGAVIGDAAAGTGLGGTLKMGLDMVDKALNFETKRDELRDTVQRLTPTIQQMKAYDETLDHPPGPIEQVMKEFQESHKLVRKYTKVCWWKSLCLPFYHDSLQERDQKLERAVTVDMQVQMARDVKEILSAMSALKDIILNLDHRISGLNRNGTAPPPPDIPS